MFWRYGGYANVSPINTLLDRPGVTVEEVLGESELLHEMKQHNSKLIEFIREDHVLKRMFEYIVSPSLLSDDEDEEDFDSTKGEASDGDSCEEGSTEAEEKKVVPRRRSDTLDTDLDREALENAEKARLKYAYICSEVLSAPSWSIIEAMMLNEESLRSFWYFLRGKPPLDSLQSSYFYKVNEVLLDQKTPEMLAFVMSLDGIVEAMLTHMDNPSIMDLLLKIISLDKPESGLVVTEWLHSNKFIPILLSYISTGHSASTQSSAGDFLKALITISANAAQNEQPCVGPNSLTRQLVSEPCLKQLISIMLQGGNPLIVAVGVVIDIIRKNNPDYDPEPLEGKDAMPSSHDPIYLGTLLRVFADHVPDFMNLILSPTKTVNEGGIYKVADRGFLSTAWGSNVEPLGFDRFKTCELMAELLHCSNMGLHNEVGSHEYMQIRDHERQYLQNQGTLARQEDSGFEYTESMNEFGNGTSPLGSGSPDEIRNSDSINTGDDDGFEDVGSASVLLEAKTISGDSKDEDGTFTHVPKLGEGDDLVDEPLTPPRHISSPEKPEVSQQNGPISPTSAGLTNEIQNIQIESNGQNSLTHVSSQGAATSSSIDNTVKATADGEPQPADPKQQSAPLTENQPQENTPNNSTSSDQHLLTPAEMECFSDFIQKDSDGRPVVGDYLKIMLYKHGVLPTILSFFFRFPWNNFLHNVVYDVVQQALNGSMDQGFNNILVVDLFEKADIPAQIVTGQRENDKAEAANNTRLGYMGHLTLISEEVVKFTERLGPETLPEEIMKTVLHPDWVNYVENTLAETRERDNAILGGVKPDMSLGHRQAVLNAIGGGQGFGASTALSNAGLNGGIPTSSFDNLNFSNQGTVSGGVMGYGTGTASLFSGFGSSSDDEDEDMDDPEDPRRGFQGGDADGLGVENGADSSRSLPIPILPPPPPSASLSGGPSRARRQLAARLAAQREAAEKAAAGASSQDAADPKSGGKTSLDSSNLGTERESLSNNSTVSNPFMSVDEDRDPDPNTEMEFVSPFAMPSEGATSSSPRHAFFPHFQPPSAYSSSSSDDDETIEAVQRNYRLPLEVFDDDEDGMGEMVAPSSGVGSFSDEDEDEETFIRETIGYSEFFGPERR